MREELKIVTVEYKKEIQEQGFFSQSFIFAKKISRKDMLKLIRSADEDLNLNTAKTVGYTLGSLINAKMMILNLKPKVEICEVIS